MVSRRMRTHPIRIRAGLLLSLFLLMSAAAGGQVLTGTLTGFVTDPANARIPGAAVTVVDLSTGRQYETISNDLGEFTFPNLTNGFYKVTVELSGFSKFIAESVQVNVAQTARIAARLEVARVGIDVAVNAEQMVVQTESMELKNAVDRRQIMELPLPTRNPLDLVRTMAGIVTATGSPFAEAFVHGLRGNSTNITHDGINVADNYVKGGVERIGGNVDAVGEFSVSVGGIGVDAGFGAAQVSIRTPRGSNAVHGSAYWFQRTNALNANTWFNNAAGVARPFQLQNRIGFNAGGPVYVPGVYDGRGRSFFFWNYEAFREPLSLPRTRTVMTSPARLGQFTYARADNRQLETVNLLPLGTIGNTGRTPAINPAVMDFYNNIVPADGLTDTGCNGDGINIRCFVFNLPGKSVRDRYTLRADHEFSDKHSVEFVVNSSRSDASPDFGNMLEPLFPKSKSGGQVARPEVFVGAFHSIFGNNKTNEVRAGYSRAPAALNLYNDFKETGGFQLFLFGSVTPPTRNGVNVPQGRNTPVFQLSDNLAWVRNRHQFRFGGEYRQITANSYAYNTVVPRVIIGTNTANPNGITAGDFPGGISAGDLTRANDVFNIITGMLREIQQGFNHTSPRSGFVPGVPRTIDPIQNNFAFFAQDSFKLRSNLNLQFGARWEYQGVFDLRNGLMLRPKEGEAGLLGPATDTLMDFAGGRNGQPLYGRDLNNFSPFLGFSWSPGNDGKTAVRGAFSVHNTQDGFSLFQPAATNNTGLFTVAINSVPIGVFSTSSNPTPAAPTASFPISQRQNFNTVSQASDVWLFRPNLRTPYVQEWNLSVQRELWNRLTIEARYVGNHAVKLFRSWNINELNLVNNGLVDEFKRAQNNLAIAGNNFSNQGHPGQTPLPIFEKLFAGFLPGEGFANSDFITWLRQNQIGSMFDSIRRTPLYQANREANFPLNFFVPNPFANQAVMVDNSSWSIYHGGVLEVARRFSSGLFFQGNYTLGKVLTDTRFLSSNQEFQRFRKINDRSLDKNRAAFDVRHSFSSNFVYPLPLGTGKWLATDAGPILNKLIGGWNVQGLTRWSSGSPFSIISNRRTTGSLDLAATADIPASLRNMTASDLQKKIGVFRTPNGVFWLDPKSGLVTVSGSTSRAVLCQPGQTTPCFDHPGVNQEGNLPFLGFDSPRFFTQDLSMIKRTAIPSISEAFNLEIRVEFFNAFNNANFNGLAGTGRSAADTIDSANFGQLTSTVDTVGGGVTSRIIQWAVKVNF